MMKLVLGGFVVSAALLVGGEEAALKKERAKFKGTWNVIKLETPRSEEDKGKEISITFHDDGSVDFKKGSESKKGKYKLNLAAKPKEIDLIPDEGDDVGKGIYQFDKDKLKVAFGEGK